MVLNEKNLFIFDARAKGQVMYNRVMGKGTESSKVYSNIQLTYLNIENKQGV